MRGAQLVGGCLVMCLLAGCSGKSVEAAQAATWQFRTRWTSGGYAEIYKQADAEFRASATEEQFKKLLDAIDRKLGPWQSAAEPIWLVSMGTSGHTVTLRYKSQFEKGPANEEFVWRVKGGGATLVGYHINSPLFLPE